MKKIGLFTLAVLSIFTLAACNQKTTQENDEKNTVNSQQTQIETKGIVEYLNNVKSTKIYVADLDYDDFEGKDQYISDVILKENGKFTSYVTSLPPSRDYDYENDISTLGVEFSKLLKMNDKELHKYLEETDKNYHEMLIADYMTGLNDFQTNYPDRYNEPVISYLKDLYSKYDYNAFKKLKSTNKVKGELTTDDFGENVETEDVWIENYASTPDDPSELIYSDTTIDELESYLKQGYVDDSDIDMEPSKGIYAVREAFQPTQISIYNKKYTIINNKRRAFIIPTDDNITFDSLETKDKNITIND
ncbi:lipoprotein [Streptococcus hyovaginalis]|uniref:LptM family lipoprotein n=1 Tax=Streptococcus hyovaginalis TaxID=149015 RepID=UPI003ADC1104